jgi:hypothetical protein
MGLQIATAPEKEPLTLTKIKEHLRVEADQQEDDALLGDLIRSGREWCEDYTHRKLINQAWDYTLDCFPIWALELPFGKCQSVDSITYFDSAGASQSLAGPTSSPVGTGWQEDLSSDNGGIIEPAIGGSWPDIQSQRRGAVTIRFTAGFGAELDKMPEPLINAILYRVADLYDVRGTLDMPQPAFAGKLPNIAETLAGPYILRRFT